MVKPKKASYSVEDIKNLLQDIENENDNTQNYSEGISVTKNALSSFILNEGEVSDYSYEAYQEIAGEAYSLEQQAKELRSIVRAFKYPIIEVPKLINDENPVISKIARWRLKLGR